MRSLNTVSLIGNLTRDPELRTLSSGTSVCSLRLAYNTSRKVDDIWTDKANYVDVTVWGRQGESCSEWLAKGRAVAVQGRLEWREWETDAGEKRQAHEIVAEHVQFIGGRDDDEGGRQAAPDIPADIPAPPTQEQAVAAGAAKPRHAIDDDIPF